MPKPTALRRTPAQRVPTAALRFRDLPGETGWLLRFAVLYVLASLATGLAIKFFPLPFLGATSFTQDLWYIIGFKLVLLLALPLAIHRRWGYRLRDLLFGWRLTARSGLVLLACYSAGVLVNAGRLAEVESGWAQHGTPDAIMRVGLGVVLAFVMAGIPEEVVFRGLLQTRLEASRGRLYAIVVSVLLFTAWHLPTRFLLAHGVEGEAGDLGSVLLGTGLPVGIVGLAFALAWDRWRNLPALIAIHAGIDTLPILSSMLQAVARTTR